MSVPDETRRIVFTADEELDKQKQFDAQEYLNKYLAGLQGVHVKEGDSLTLIVVQVTANEVDKLDAEVVGERLGNITSTSITIQEDENI